MESSTPAKANGLKTALDVIIAPKEAFESISVHPTWGWAIVIAIVLTIAGGFLMGPSMSHAMMGDFAKQAATNPGIAQMTDDQRQKFANLAPFFTLASIFILPFFMLINALIMLACNAIGKGAGGFGKLWAATVNIGIIYGIFQIVLAIVTIARGPDSFPTSPSIQQALSLAALMPDGNPKLVALMAAINPFYLWSVVLTAMAMTTIAKVGKGPAWIAGILTLWPVIFGVAFAR